jgi:3-hydroxyisobutyrate dehydrogenase
MRAAAMDALVAAGGNRAEAASAAASGADMLILMVVNAAQAEQVLFADGALEAMPAGGIVALMATCPPGTVEKLAARVLAAGRRFLDAPVSGGVVGATSATLTIMAAAPPDTFGAARPVLEALGDKIFHVGDRPGQGSVVKTVNQLLCGVHIAVVAEALSLAGRVGVDANVVLEILGGSSASSWMLKDRGPRMLQADPVITSAVDIFVKDLGIVMEAGREAKTALPFAALAHQLFLATSGRGAGSADDSQVIRTYHAMNGGPMP